MCRDKLREILTRNQILSYGICDYNGITEFLPCRNREWIPENAKSVIVCAFPYYTGEYPDADVCKYAMVPDYHVVVRQILNQAAAELREEFQASFVGFTDVSALPERQCDTLVLMLICGLGFPLLLNGLSALIFPHQADGSLVTAGDKVLGSEFVGQEFTKPYFMKSRPSAVHYNTYFVDEAGNEVYADGSEFGGLASGSQNMGPSNPALAERVEADIAAFLEDNPEIKREDIPTDLLTASGSGLDPHISPASAAVQLPALSQASGLTVEQLEAIVANNTTGKLLGLFGEETVNVLGVNLEIAQAMGLI